MELVVLGIEILAGIFVGAVLLYAGARIATLAVLHSISDYERLVKHRRTSKQLEGV